jgi:hypothetical protein
MSFGDFMRDIGQVLTPPERIRDWRKLKRQYRAYLQDLGQDPSAVRSGVRAWVKLNPKPKRTKEEREKIYSDIPQIYEEGKELFGGNGVRGGDGTDSASFTGMTSPPRKAGFNPLLLLLLIPVLFPKLLKNF